MSWLAVGFLVAGLLLLLVGGEALVRGAVAMAAAWGVSPLMIGLTVVAFGTSAPEFAVSVGSALTGRPEIAVGNVIGSNIFNVLVILGLAALVSPLTVSRQLIRIEVPILIAVTALSLVLTWDAQVGRLDGSLLVLCLLVYLGFAIYQGRKEGNAVNVEALPGGPPRLVLQLLLVGVGLVLLAWGANWFVRGAESIARWLGVSDLIIALTVVAGGTSLPEVAASVMAALKGERDIAVGNVVGSNLFNLLGVLGLTGLITPGGVDVAAEALAFDLPVMMLVALVCLPVFFTGSIVSRWEGAVFLGYYAGYIAYLVLRATDPAAQALYHDLLVYVALPGTLAIIALSVWQHFRWVRAQRG